MSRFFVNDDIFSPVRFDDLSGDSEGASNDSEENDPININASFLSSDVEKNKKIVESGKKYSKRESGRFKLKDQHIASISPKSANSSTASDRNSSNFLNTKKLTSDFAKVKAVKKNVSENNSESQKQDSLCWRNNLDGHLPTPDSSEEMNVKTSLLVSKNYFGKSLGKDIKKQKNIQSSNSNLSPIELDKSNKKLPPKELTASSLHFIKKIGDLTSEDTSTISADQKVKFSDDDSVNNISSYSFEDSQNLKSTCNCSCLPDKELIQKMVHQAFHSETMKIRHDMYSHAWDFYKQLNKIKDEMEKEHSETTESLLKIIEELMKMKASLE